MKVYNLCKQLLTRIFVFSNNNQCNYAVDFATNNYIHLPLTYVQRQKNTWTKDEVVLTVLLQQNPLLSLTPS